MLNKVSERNIPLSLPDLLVESVWICYNLKRTYSLLHFNLIHIVICVCKIQRIGSSHLRGNYRERLIQYFCNTIKPKYISTT